MNKRKQTRIGNLVTSRIDFEARDGATGIEAFGPVLGHITPMTGPEILARLSGAPSPAEWLDVPFDMNLAAPQPKVFEGFACVQGIELGLAILPKRDLVGSLWESRHRFFNDLPPHMVRTSHSVLAENDMADMSRDERIAQARKIFPKAIAEGERALRAFESTAHFDPVTWREKNWGTRTHAENVYLWLNRGNLCIKFDTVNQGPYGWLRHLATSLPGFHFSGVSYDQDTDYSLHFVTQDPGEIEIEESNDPEDVTSARAFVAGMTVEEMIDHDREMFGE